MKNLCRGENIYQSSVIGFIGSLGGIVFFCGVNNQTLAQSIPPAGVTIPPNTPERVEETIPQPIESPQPTPETPPTPSFPTPTTPSQNQETSPTTERFLIKKIEILGNTICIRSKFRGRDLFR